DVKELINNLAFTYHINEFQMQNLVRDSINEKGMIDKNVLRKNCRNIYQIDNGGNLPTLIYSKQPDYLKKPTGDNSKWAKMVYTFENTTPYNYLKAQYKGSEPTSRDLRLIENLLIDYKLNPGVVNVLISYVLKINNQKLNKNYIETIVGQWKRLNVETVEDAMRVTEKEHKKLKKMVSKDKIIVKTNKVMKEEAIPAWFDKEISKNSASSEEEDEMCKLLEEIE
ncbi:MAG: DnaD domain protein, partial [Bacilli bacterium]|nr:DnaD domain protein [Bacilli bacterium]